MAKPKSKNSGNPFGTVVSKVSLSSKVEIHFKEGAKMKNGTEAVNIAKYVMTQRYTGYAPGGYMVPNEKWKAFLKAANKVKVD
jgi:hypothetical protein